MTAVNSLSSYESPPTKGTTYQWTAETGGKNYCVTIRSDGETSGRLQGRARRVAEALHELGIDVISVDVEEK